MPDDFAQLAEVIGNAAVASSSAQRLKAWWIYRMLFTPDPLTEKLTLMWHNHFATSNLKVDDLAAMRAQNELFRKHCRAPFAELLSAVVHDPAMLVWLDADSNRKGRPNENLARELMELFTLGIGNYSEEDVKQAARALTGWTLRQGAFHENVQHHDDGEKTILDRRGMWQGDDLLRMLLERPETSRRLAWRICQVLMGEGVVDETALDELAEGLREHNLSIHWAVETVLRSTAFFAETNIGARVSDPVEFIVGTARALEIFDPPPSTLLLAEWAGRLGQDLFSPPNVGGWTGGRDWLSSRSVVARANYAAALVEGRLSTHAALPPLTRLVERHADAKNLESTIDFLSQLLLGERLGSGSRGKILSLVSKKTGSPDEQTRWALALMLALPEAQLA